jgi:polar amino acid transport system substrate-binding protein
LLLVFLTGISFAQGKELRWGGDSEGGAPYVFQDPKNPRQTIGFEVDLAAALGAKLNRPPVFVQNQWDSLIPGLQRGNYDLALNGLEVTEDRKTQIDFFASLLRDDAADQRPRRREFINSLADLKERRSAH